jgi:hypothetical protein
VPPPAALVVRLRLLFERRLEGSLAGCFYSGSGVTYVIEPGGRVFEFRRCAVVGGGPVILLLLLLVLSCVLGVCEGVTRKE